MLNTCNALLQRPFAVNLANSYSIFVALL